MIHMRSRQVQMEGRILRIGPEAFDQAGNHIVISSVAQSRMRNSQQAGKEIGEPKNCHAAAIGAPPRFFQMNSANKLSR